MTHNLYFLANIHARSNHERNTPLHIAAQRGSSGSLNYNDKYDDHEDEDDGDDQEDDDDDDVLLY